MPQALIVIFLLFFAVLAFAWFYWQRAKARTVTVTEATTAEATTSEPTAPEPTATNATVTEERDPTESTPAS